MPWSTRPRAWRPNKPSPHTNYCQEAAMATEIKVPVLPESVADATIAAWHKKVGDSVSRDENIVDLETDKVVLEVPSTVDGVIKELKFEEGDTVTSQQLLAVIKEGAAAEDAPKAESGSGDKEAPAAGDE